MTSTDDDSPEPIPQLTDAEVASILSGGGWWTLLELCRAGRINTERAVTAIDEHERPSFWSRVGTALIDTFFGP
jgi:hypothetical protein